jgi:uncharacterized protein (TIGR02996 family)
MEGAWRNLSLMEETFLEAIRIDPDADPPRHAYADWLDECGDFRGEFLRLHLSLRPLPPDDVLRKLRESQLSRIRRRIDRDWLAVVAPEFVHLDDNSPGWPVCACFDKPSGLTSSALSFHVEPQDTECDAWKRLLDLVEETAAGEREEFHPRGSMDPADWSRIVTLPPTISRLKSVTHLHLYGSHLVRLPPEIGQMTSLEKFTPYTSHRLHWFPYEITRCKNLRDSTVSTRVLYGNFKDRPPFPKLGPTLPAGLPDGTDRRSPAPGNIDCVRRCSVCDRSFDDIGSHRVWISMQVATDVLPLLVNACSEECVRRLPSPARGYVQEPHRGGPEVQQPESYYMSIRRRH